MELVIFGVKLYHRILGSAVISEVIHLYHEINELMFLTTLKLYKYTKT
jgi:hypothetical protein